MASLVQEVIDLIEADAPLMAVLEGGVWPRPLKRNVSSSEVPTPGSTPEAFDGEGFVLTAASLQQLSAPAALLQGPPGAYGATLVVWLNVPSRDATPELFESFWKLLYDALNGQQIDGGNGTGAKIEVGGWFGPFVAPELGDVSVSRNTLSVFGVWS